MKMIATNSMLLFNFFTFVILLQGEGNGTPLQYSCLENPMDRGAWWAAVHGVAKSRTRLSDFTLTFPTWGSKRGACFSLAVFSFSEDFSLPFLVALEVPEDFCPSLIVWESGLPKVINSSCFSPCASGKKRKPVSHNITYHIGRREEVKEKWLVQTFVFFFFF